jgi:WD40 repeat protein
MSYVFRGASMVALRLSTSRPETTGHQGEVLSCSFDDDGTFVLTSGWDGALRCWDTRTGAPLAVVKTGGQAVCACAVAPWGRWLAGSLDGLLTTWDPVTHQKVGELLPHTRPITSLAVSPCGTCLASSAYDATVRLYRDPSNLTCNQVLKGHSDAVMGCCFAPDGRTLLSWSADGNIGLWDVATGTRLVKLHGGKRITCAAASANGLWVAAGTEGGIIQLWDLEKPEVVQSRRLRDPLAGCFVLTDDKTMLTVDVGGRLTLFALPGLEQIRERVTLFGVRSCACAPAGDRVVLGSATGRPSIVDITCE